MGTLFSIVAGYMLVTLLKTFLLYNMSNSCMRTNYKEHLRMGAFAITSA